MMNRTFATSGLLALLAAAAAFGQQMQTLSLGPALDASFNAEPTVYVVTGYQQFGTVDLATGAFQQIGPLTPEPLANLIPAPDGRLLSLSASGNLDSIDPSTGAVTVIGPTGLGYNAFDLAAIGGRLYATDFSNNLYSVNPATGAARLIRATGMPPDPNVPFTTNPDGTVNLCDETLYGLWGELYATFDSFKIDPVSLAETAVVQPKLYRIDPRTGEATPVAPTSLNLGASVEVKGRFYAFKIVATGFSPFGPEAYSQVVTLDLKTGETGFVANVDPAAGPIFGAAPYYPEWAACADSRRSGSGPSGCLHRAGSASPMPGLRFDPGQQSAAAPESGAGQ